MAMDHIEKWTGRQTAQYEEHSHVLMAYDDLDIRPTVEKIY